MENTLANKIGIQAGDGLQTRSWRHNLCGGSFRCVLCGERADRWDFVSTTLFDGQEELGDLCEACVVAGPATAALHEHRWAEELGELAKDLRTLNPAR